MAYDPFPRGWHDMTAAQQQLLQHVQEVTDGGFPDELRAALADADASEQDKTAVRKFLEG